MPDAPQALQGRLNNMVADTSLLTEVLSPMRDGVVISDASRKIIFWNSGAERITGYGASEVIGRSCWDGVMVPLHCTSDMTCSDTCPVEQALHEKTPRTVQVYCLHHEGYRFTVEMRIVPLIDDKGAVLGVIQVFSDREENRQLREEIERLTQVASTDPLTGLPNRRALDEALDLALYRYRRHGHLFGLILIDLDFFKRVNDEHGHKVGDRLLRAVAKTLLHARRRDEIAARWGGEEFVIIAQPITDLQQLTRAAERIRSEVSRARVYAGDEQVKVTASAGATLVRPRDIPESLLARADVLLYQSKNSGRDRTSVG